MNGIDPTPSQACGEKTGREDDAPVEKERGGLVLSFDGGLLDADFIHRFLTEESYWAKNITRRRLDRAIEHSLCVGVYDGGRQVAFARAVTDRATFAWLADVFVAAEYRRRGIASWMVEAMLKEPDLEGLRLWLLGTRDAHAVYAGKGFAPVAYPERFMWIFRPHRPEDP